MAVNPLDEYLTTEQIAAFAKPLPLSTRIWNKIWFGAIHVLRLKFRCVHCGLPTKAVPMLHVFGTLRKWDPAVCYRDECLDKDTDDLLRRAGLLK